MPSNPYTNAPNAGAPGQYLVRTRVRETRPYVANGSFSNLTDREKLARQQLKTSSFSGGLGMNTTMSQGDNFFSPQLSTDFLELPQSLREKREIYRHFYNTDELVGQAIDLHTELPLSKVRLAPPKPRTNPEGFDSPEDYGKYILSRFERMCKKVKLFQRLITIVHHYWLDGTVAIFAEDSDVPVPQDVGYERQQSTKSVLREDGTPVEEPTEEWVERGDREQQELVHYAKHYPGWNRIIVLPIDKVKITTTPFSDKVRIELIPSDRDRKLIDQANMGDPAAEEMVAEMPSEVREYIEAGKLIPLGTDPNEGSFVFLLSGRKGSDSELGQSILDRCHLPGMPVLARRDGQVLQTLIEDLDPETDEVLSAKGNWREFEHGMRVVDEDVAVIRVAKLDQSILCTKDHKYPVLREREVIEAEAGDLVPGDYLQVAQVPLTESLDRVDLAAFLEGTEEPYRARKSGREVVQTIEVTCREEDSFTVRYSRPITNPKREIHVDGLTRAASWLRELTEPTSVRALKFCDRFGFNHNSLEKTLQKLGELGAVYEVAGRPHAKSSAFDIVFQPSAVAEVPQDVETVKTFPRWLRFDDQFGYFLGFWLGDGHISRQDGLQYGSLGFTYGPDEPASVLALDEVVKPVIESVGGTWSESRMATGIHTDTYQDALVRWMAGNFGHISEDKHLPDWVFDAPVPFLKALLRGFVDSDGDVVQKKDGSVSVRMNNTNAVLMDQVFLLCTSLGIPASKTQPTKRRLVKQADGRLSPAKPCYAVHFTHGPSVKAFFESGFLAKKKRPDVWKDGRSGSRHKVHDGRLFYRVQGVGEAHHTGPVYSLNVHVDHSLYVCSVSTRNCLRTLYYREKLRQAQTSIASRAMTPKRIVWAEGLSDTDVEDLREQVDLALVDPDYSIVANYEIRWEEMGARDRLLDLSVEYEQTERRLITGLGVTESLMSGESLYSGDRLKLEVMNNRYIHLREIIQEFVQENLFEPVARRMGFIEKDKWGQEVVLFPQLSFTRLPLRDSQDTFDALFNLYQKGSVSIDVILEALNIDPHDTRLKIEQDTFTVNDAVFNEVMRSVYSEVGRMLAEKTNILDKIAGYLNLEVKEDTGEEEGRY